MTDDAGLPRGLPPGHRPFRPTPAEPIRWPDDFGRRFTLFCDVEEEFDWRAPLDPGQRATTAMRAFPAAHRRFAEAGAGLTCMVDHPVATDPAAVDLLAEAAAHPRSAIGAQLHAWVTPPFAAPVTPFTSYQGNLPPALEAAKIAALTAALTAAFDAPPRAFRAGRYGLGPATLALLRGAGYRLDSSVRAGYDYRADGGPDFRAIGNAAWRDQGVVELPLTTIHTGLARRGGKALHRALGAVPFGRGLAARAGLIQRVALTPEDMPLAAALQAIDVAARDGERLLAFSFHSPSLAPGFTPYVRDEHDLAAFWGWWSAVLERLAARGYAHASLMEVLAAACA